ncbi:MAG: putative membrane protein [Candidatus Moranbacteria bacterium GW2011_GWE1_36_7]|nr:MAG: putative membrane protein [Candidatus Moranbacteria bacterium GW2011_GWD2_36_12]KKQ06646.1 MAG: putative membrane protein [Candidatus Moranbacteria bacterium GW2011_GWE2_36_40]KKQ15194.1 MAG: putative membrane protein [Candidatus Moranbacteria bacterium GW2011_GWE1_36_7]
MFSAIIVIFGLIIFEVISSIDNAIVNAHVLKTLPEKQKKFFLLWGMLIAVFLVRGILPFLIIWLVNPALSFVEVFRFAFSGDSSISEYVEKSKPLLLLGGGVYLYLVALAWLFLEEKKYAFLVEHFIHRKSAWFYAISSISLTAIIYISLKIDPILALSATIGSTAFFITDGFKKNAEEKEKELMSGKSGMGAWSKVLYLEVLDASFSIDGVIGAFAFTISVPLILIGNGIGAIVVREFTIRGMDIITKFAYLKNGAMYSIGFLGAIMILESFGQHYPFWFAPMNTLLLLAIFLYLSYRELQLAKA